MAAPLTATLARSSPPTTRARSSLPFATTGNPLLQQKSPPSRRAFLLLIVWPRASPAHPSLPLQTRHHRIQRQRPQQIAPHSRLEAGELPRGGLDPWETDLL